MVNLDPKFGGLIRGLPELSGCTTVQKLGLVDAHINDLYELIEFAESELEDAKQLQEEFLVDLDEEAEEDDAW